LIFTEPKLAGVFVIDLDREEDNRGFFARTFCQHEFADHGLKTVIAPAPPDVIDSRFEIVRNVSGTRPNASAASR
jgi:dTDP-4-dehydrorhamnose 3,5-epimerase-like enzyme